MKEKQKITKGTVIVLIAFLGTMAILNLAGAISADSGIRIGWFENKAANTWSASYISFSGVSESSLNTGSTSAVLHVSIETKGGTIALEMKDANENLVYSEKDISTSSFNIDVSGAVMATVTAKNHRGSFNISW